MSEPRKPTHVTGSLPFCEDAEKGLLCSILLSPTEVIAAVREQACKKSFYIPAHQIVYELLLELSDKNKPIDFVVLRQVLRDRGQLEEIGGPEYLSDLYQFVPTHANFKHYANIVREKDLLRTAALGAQKIIGLAQDPGAGADFESVRNEIEKLLTALSGQVHIHEQTLREITVQWHEQLASRAERLKREGFRFGIPSVDLALGPIAPGSYVVISAETSGGKSLFAFQGALHAARQGLPVAAFSLEMTDQQLLDRMFAHLCRVSMNSFREGLFGQDEITRLNAEVPRFVDMPFYLGQTRGNDIGTIASKLRRLKVKHGIKVAVVDYLQRILPSTNRKDGTRYLEVAEVSDRLKSLALELELVMIAPCQLNREGYTREAASIEHDADFHLKLVQPDPDNDPNQVRLLVEKNRQGPRFLSVELQLDAQFMTLSDRSELKLPSQPYRD
jgi:replicative DNA helicase